MEALKEQYNSLKPYLFPNIDERLYQADCKGVFQCKNVANQNRICNDYFYSLQLFKQDKPYFDPYEILQSASTEPKDMLQMYSPLYVQAFVAFIQNTFTNPPLMASALKRNVNSLLSFHLIYSTLPAIFGYFSTKEQTSQAVSFYSVLSTLLPYDLYIETLKPFFCSACLEIFASSTIDSIFFKYYIQKFEPEKFTKLLISIVQNRLQYLPAAHFSLLRYLSMQWPKENIWKLIMNSIILPQLEIRYRLSPFAQSYLVNFDIDRLTAFISKYSKWPNINFNQQWHYEIPGDFIFQDNTCAYDLIFTKADIAALTPFEEDVLYHGPRLSEIVLKSTKPGMHSPFRFILYPKTPVPAPNPERPLMFSVKEYNKSQDSSLLQLWNSIEKASLKSRVDPIELVEQNKRTGNAILDQKLQEMDHSKIIKFGLEETVSELTKSANLFEKLLSHKLAERQLKSWCRTASDYASKLSVSIAAFVTKKDNKKSPWELVKSVPCFGFPRYFVLLMAISRIEQELIRPHSKAVAEMDTMFIQLLSTTQMDFQRNPNFGSPSVVQRIEECNVLLSTVRAETDFFGRAVVLMNYLEEAEVIGGMLGISSRESVDQMIHYALAMNFTGWVFRTVLVLDGAVFSDPRFEEYVGPLFVEMWARFKATFLQFLARDEATMRRFAEMTTSGALFVQ